NSIACGCSTLLSRKRNSAMIRTARLYTSIMLFLIVTSAGRAAALQLEIVADDKVVWSAAIENGETFDISYEHSQEHITWTHHYVALPEGISQVSSTFSAYGAGMPLAGTASRTATGFTAPEFRRLGDLRMMNWRASQIRLRYRGREFTIG